MVCNNGGVPLVPRVGLYPASPAAHKLAPQLVQVLYDGFVHG
jgi:hypothetical protein